MHTAPTTITFHRADPAHVHELLDMLDGDGFRFEHSSAVVAPLHLFRAYGKHHAGTDICALMPPRVREIDPRAGFVICQDPTDEFAGDRIVCDPELGDFASAADGEGQPLIAETTLRAAIDEARAAIDRGEPDHAIEVLDRAGGGPWRRHIEQLRRTRERQPSVVPTSPTPPDPPTTTPPAPTREEHPR